MLFNYDMRPAGSDDRLRRRQSEAEALSLQVPAGTSSDQQGEQLQKTPQSNLYVLHTGGRGSEEGNITH